MNIGGAVQALKSGARVARPGWNGKGMWLSLARGLFTQDLEVGAAEVLPYVIMKTADDKIVPWLCSQTDLLAEDWEVVG